MNYVVYAIYPSSVEVVVGSYETRKEAVEAIMRYKNAHPTVTGYINDDVVE